MSTSRSAASTSAARRGVPTAETLVSARRASLDASPQRGLLQLQAAIGNRAIARLLEAGRTTARPRRPAVTPRRAVPSGRHSVQRKWIDDNPPLKVWDTPRNGYIWYLNEETNELHYRLASMDVVAGMSVKQRAEIVNGQNKPFPFQMWVDAGWIDGPAAAAPVAPKADAAAKAPKAYSGSTAGIEIENPAPYQLKLGPRTDRGVIGWVESLKGEKLAELTTDMGANPYTVELRTIPAVEADKAAVDLRKAALKLLTDELVAAGDANRGVPSKVVDELKIVIPDGKRDHSVVPVSSDKRPGVQITKGISFSEMVNQSKNIASSQGILGAYAAATWMQFFGGYHEHFLKKHKGASDAAVVFGMLASLIHFYMRRIDWAGRTNTEGGDGIGGKGLVKGELEIRPDLVNPTEKNAWNPLPKTPPAEWLKELKSDEVSKVKEELRTGVPGLGQVNPTAWKAINTEIMGGSMIAGHAVPEFRIGSERGYAFEIRTPTIEDQSAWMPDAPTGGASAGTGDAWKTDQVYVKLNITDPSLLDRGSKLLHDLTRPAVVNNATADKLSNCALTTLAGIEGRKTSGDVSGDLRKAQGLPASVDQSQRIWAMTMLDAQTLRGAGLLAPTASADQDRAKKLIEQNKGTIRSMEEFAEGASFVVGDAQYYGMLQHLLQLAGKIGTDDVQYKVFEHGEPGNAMFDQKTLVSDMASFPNGTRFAVFLYSPDPTQHVRQHWVYAEKFSGAVVFKDFQVSPKATTGGSSAVDSYLNAFPFSPDVKTDKGKSFEQGMCIAFVPFFTGEKAPEITAGREVDAATISGILAGTGDRLRVLSEKVTTPGNKMPSVWPTLPSAKKQSAIPAPSAVEAAIKGVTSSLGIPGAKTAFGSLTKAGIVKIIGDPVHSSIKQQLTRRQGLTDVSETMLTDQISVPNRNAETMVVHPGAAPSADGAELPAVGGKGSAETDYRQAFANQYQISAQNTESGIILNANNSAFTDLIHEATHSFEAETLPMHFREGLTEIFASMAARQLETAGSDSRFDFSYNETYSHYTAAMEKLVAWFGLESLAKLYFVSKDHAETLKQMVLARNSSADPHEADAAVELLLGDDFPGSFKSGMAKLETLVGALPGPAKPRSAIETTYKERQDKFAGFLVAEKKKLETRFGSAKMPADTADPLELGIAVDQWASVRTAEERLTILYRHKGQVTGKQFVQLMKLIDGHEAAILAATGETREAMRKRILPTVTVTFEVEYQTRPGQDLFVAGDAAELGGVDGKWNPAKALRLDWSPGGIWRGSISLPATGELLSHKYFVKEGGAITWETSGVGEHHAYEVPSTPGGSVTFRDRWGNVKGL